MNRVDGEKKLVYKGNGDFIHEFSSLATDFINDLTSLLTCL